MCERPCHYTAKRGSDAAAIGTQVPSVPAIFPGTPECRVDYGVIHDGR